MSVAVVLGWSLLAAWGIFLSLTAIVFLLAFRSIFPPSIGQSTVKEDDRRGTATLVVKEFESMVRRGFEEQDPQAQAKTFEALKRIFMRKVKRRYGMSEAELKTLIENPSRLEAVLGEPELVRLLSAKLNLSRGLWSLGRLSNLIGKVEDWGR